MSCTIPNVLSEDQSGYFATRAELQRFLENRFGLGLDFQIVQSNYRWKFKTPEELQQDEVKSWIATLQKERQANSVGPT